MDDGAQAPRVRASWQFWMVSALSLIWNAFGSYDYTTTQIRDPGYMAAFPPAMIDWLDTFPAWATAAWAIGVWGSLAGSLLLLLRSRHAIIAFEASFLGAVVSFAYQFLSGDMPAEALTPTMIGMSAAILVLIVVQWWFAKRQRAAGVLT